MFKLYAQQHSKLSFTSSSEGHFIHISDIDSNIPTSKESYQYHTIL